MTHTVDHYFLLSVPDFHVEGKLEAIHVLLDKPQLELIKGLIEMNLGESIEEFEKPSTVIHDPIAQVCVCVCVCGRGCVCVCMHVFDSGYSCVCCSKYSDTYTV